MPPTPVVISEFGTLRDGQSQNQWIEDAFAAIENNYQEIKSVIYFNSKVDDNWPKGLQLNDYLDWTIPRNQVIKTSFKSKEVPEYVFTPLPVLTNNSTENISSFSHLKEIKGINLKYGHDWRKNYHVLNRRKLSADFEKIKMLGLNSIKFSGNSFYDYNILNISEEFDFNVAFGFWIPAYLDFMNDTLKTNQLKKAILKKVAKYKKYAHISSWNIQNDVLYNQKDFFHKPELLYQNRAYILWLKKLVSEMKKIDPERPVIIDLEVNLLSIYHSQLLANNINGIGCFGLTVKEDDHLSALIDYFENSEMGFIFSEIDTETLIHPEIWDSQPSFFVTSWQDQHESNNLTFDGITDRKGRAKDEYLQLYYSLHEPDTIINKKNAKILKPATPLYENSVYCYYSMLCDEVEGWKYGLAYENYSFEWALVKCDEHGNYLAVKDIDTCPVLRLKIPENQEYFKLLLTVSDGNSVSSTITTLNTPLICNEDNF
ncbi:MAG: hypothetical protein ACP5D9_13290 [Mariniphaga sp.]